MPSTWTLNTRLNREIVVCMIICMNVCVLYLKKNSLGIGKGHHMDPIGITAESFNISTSSRVGT